MPEPFTKERRVFIQRGGLLRTTAAIQAGIHPRTLYEMRDKGIVEQLSRGLFRLASLPSLSNPDLVTVALKVPRGVICLISALAYHEITTRIPHEIYVAVPRGTEPPRLQHPPASCFLVHWAIALPGRDPAAQDGWHCATGLQLQEKTLADCFKYRNKIGLDTVLGAPKVLSKPETTRRRRSHEIRVCRVERVMRALTWKPCCTPRRRLGVRPKSCPRIRTR